MVLMFGLNGKPSSPNTARGKQQADRLPILTANRRDTFPPPARRCCANRRHSPFKTQTATGIAPDRNTCNASFSISGVTFSKKNSPPAAYIFFFRDAGVFLRRTSQPRQFAASEGVKRFHVDLRFPFESESQVTESPQI